MTDPFSYQLSEKQGIIIYILVCSSQNYSYVVSKG